MADPVLLNTARGAYRLSLVEQTEAAGLWVLTLSAEHAGGLEKFAFRCHVAAELLKNAGIADPAAVCARLAGWIEREFEQVREAALKSIRSEHRMADFEFDEARPGPF